MTLRYSLLDEPLIGIRLVADGRPVHLSLPGLFVAMEDDAVRDFPALRPHQRHPWHAFLVQVAAIAINTAGRSRPFDSEEAWKDALLALTPQQPEGDAWCLISPHDKPAFLQAPVAEDDLHDWDDDKPTPDSLDILITSKNHDLKQERIGSARPDDWIFALMSLQTAAPFPGRGNYGVARMNGGSSSRPGLGLDPPGGAGRRWQRDVCVALAERPRIVVEYGYSQSNGVGLLWLDPWDGKAAYSFAALDPFFIEISRRVRLILDQNQIKALRTTTAGPRIAKDEAKSRKGNTGDLWTPIEIASGKSLGVSGTGFHYKRMVDLLFNSNYRKPPAQVIRPEDDAEGVAVLARAIAGGQSTTDGYHERRIPVSRTVRKLLIRQQTDRLAMVASERVQAIGKIRTVLWKALVTLFDNGVSKQKAAEGTADKANNFASSFEQGEDDRFFEELNTEIESDQPEAVRLRWYLSMAERAEAILKDAFDAGPRSGEQRYRARAAALSRFHRGLRSNQVLPTLANHYQRLRANKEIDHASA